ncbi:2-hydroxyacylsphingosine 1-beta-galactosyltransferase-like [Spodoptera litura]|uniref:2-hydroxyacylsphingosine 1-beta-galactosyltransferase-like n=1 Tax=Spodoptera litura TaxID=69820 RepID=A0A9J7E1K9_SPOLT|nr:2-hydroxyacylsphingosine 1-beta-galactosyltransferase-like [Spodoptera litura]
MEWSTLSVVCVAALLVSLAQLGAGGAVLVVFPVPRRSHTLLGDHLVTTLLHAGHNVTYVTTFTRVKASDRFTLIDIGSAADDEEEPSRTLSLEPSSSRLPSHQFLADGTSIAEGALRHRRVQALLKDVTQSFDLVVAEWYYSGLLAPLGAVFECPLVWYSAGDASWLSVQLVHEPSSATYFVDPLAASLPRLPPGVPDRLRRLARQAYLSAWVYYMTHYVETPAYYEIYQLAIQLRGRTPPLYEELLYDGALLLVNSHPALGQGVPLPNNAKYIGGHHLTATNTTLPKNLQTLLDNAKHGVIYFNLGGTVSEELPLEVKRELMRVFRQLEQLVVWRHRGASGLQHAPGNVHLVERAPHPALLKHPNTIMMITHGGFLSYMEAMYYGVPIIGMPVQEDQLLTIDVAASRGRAIKVHLSNAGIGYKLNEAIFEILGNYSYRSNAKEASVLLRDRLVPASQELLYWMELMMKTGGAPALRSPALQLSTIERYHLDVAAVLLMLAWFLSKVAKVVKVYWDDFGTDTQYFEDKKNE